MGPEAGGSASWDCLLSASRPNTRDDVFDLADIGAFVEEGVRPGFHARAPEWQLRVISQDNKNNLRYLCANGAQYLYSGAAVELKIQNHIVG